MADSRSEVGLQECLLEADGRRDDEHDVRLQSKVRLHLESPESSPQEPQRRDISPLARGVDAVSHAVEELKARLATASQINEALERDLRQSQDRVSSLSRERDRLAEKITQLEEETFRVDDVRQEMAQLRRERDALSRKVRDLAAALGTSEQRSGELGRLLDTIRAERNGASEEAAALEVQFSRAMRVIERLREELDARARRNQEHDAQIKLLGRRLDVAVGERDELKRELEESHHALEEIRESFLAASRMGSVHSGGRDTLDE